MNRRGFIGDVFTLLVTGFSVSVMVLVMVLIIVTVNTAFQADAGIDAGSKALMQSGRDQYPGSMDTFLIIMLFGLPLIAAAFIYFLDVSPIFLWIILLLSIFFVLVGAVFANMWDVIVNADAFVTIAAEMPMTLYVLNNYALYALYAIIVVIAGMFFRMRGGSV